MRDWKDEDEVQNYIRRILSGEAGDHSGLVYGMGHAVYTLSDPRTVILKSAARKLAQQRGMLDELELMEAIEREAAASGARMIVLETQSCNEAAIAFYRKNGFSVIGFDLYAYSNTDPERHEVRIEMGKKLHGPSVR